jgi:hypothetical protein
MEEHIDLVPQECVEVPAKAPNRLYINLALSTAKQLCELTQAHANSIAYGEDLSDGG